MDHFASLQTVTPANAFPELTDREREILSLIAQHHTNPEIAERLGISPKTVRNHVSNIFNKLQVIDRAQAVLRARDAGLDSVPVCSDDKWSYKDPGVSLRWQPEPTSRRSRPCRPPGSLLSRQLLCPITRG